MSAPEYILKSNREEVRRLRAQAEALAAEAAVMLERIGIGAGWRCAELGCGAGGIMDLLSRRVGPAGKVVGVDLEAGNLAAARLWADDLGLANIEFVQADIIDSGLPAADFDFVHVRFVLTTVGRHHDVVAAAAELLRPGGVLAIEEADGFGVDCFPQHPAFYRLREILFAIFHQVGDPDAGRKTFGLLRQAGLVDLHFRPCQAGAVSTDDMANYLPETVRSVRPVLLEAGLIGDGELDEVLAACETHLADPGTVSTHVGVFQTWGTKLS
ncbi:MAG: methyltransferase domain-containing protein [Alphaproteobacteria bacterium]|jgi:SAM-dependent methyltransferase|nr:methyltransferase domain-containing protein [Alphaproteobacteria bacterium]MDP6565581.1 methyltransferase domain-containing protein [Alphaproteobacteria bacterium]MDP6814620.1 methyltransferase domain-containing protein [Alphaproteobacteria bacterium]